MKIRHRGYDIIFAQFLTVVLHPLLVPLYSILILYLCKSAARFQLSHYPALQIFLPLIIFTIVLPGGFVLILQHMGKISSMYLHRRIEREGPLIFAAASALLLDIVYVFIAPNPFLLTFPIALLMSLFMAWIINKFWKISIHLTGLGGLSSIIIFVIWPQKSILPYIILILIVVGILLGWARWRLKAHTFLQVIMGWMNGFVATMFCLMFFPEIFSSFT